MSKIFLMPGKMYKNNERTFVILEVYEESKMWPQTVFMLEIENKKLHQLFIADMQEQIKANNLIEYNAITNQHFKYNGK